MTYPLKTFWRNSVAIKKYIGTDVEKLKLQPKQKRIVQCFLEIECEPDVDHTPRQAKTLREKIVQEVDWAIDNLIFYDPEKKKPIPLWHKLFVSSYDCEGRGRELRYLLRHLGRLLRSCDNRIRL